MAPVLVIITFDNILILKTYWSLMFKNSSTQTIMYVKSIYVFNLKIRLTGLNLANKIYKEHPAVGDNLIQVTIL